MREIAAYLALRAGLGVVGMLPARAARAAGLRAGGWWHRLDRSRREMAGRHMERVTASPELAPELSKELMRSYGRYWAEALWVRKRRISEVLASTRVEGLDMVLEARDEGKGMIFALPHMGNWEVAAPIAGREGIQVVAVAEKLGNDRITRWFTEMRGAMGIEIVLATGGSEVMRRLEAALGDNKAVALLSDRDLGGRGVEVEFFGDRTTMPPGPATLALRTGAPVFPVGTYFEPDGHRVLVRPPLAVPEGPRKVRVGLMTQALARELEKLIATAPEQWHMVVPNWPGDRA